jgi:hypothetical protein
MRADRIEGSDAAARYAGRACDRGEPYTVQNTPQSGAPSGEAPQPSSNPSGQPYRPPRPAWWYWVGGGIVAIVLCCGCAGIASLASHGGNTTTGNSGGNIIAANQPGGSTTPNATPTATHTPQWTTVQKFSGTTSQKTPLFDVPSEWRIVWSCKKSNDFGGNFIVNVMNADGTPMDYAVVNTMDNDGSTTYEHQGDGQVYLDIQTYNEKWTIQVQVQQ